ncbi:RsmB/NOP family class I SAM-dependent RNA methyltransferase [Venatoribacter cucullus]|uniref:RsmB/NOP family class I SAM-dependent RNA methyltransferase n=1 Tax=Venatoribacter cucullus TaxID=2661630 RepID=UPI0022400992|nr:RsmB/NOP family class I SAM-dependent RNA methyltransferase [Venatoribacter cucullus]UZK04222.1 RsmB/NOP family class I SAM-dependent RNA methyltransferase [Venatoribacter cucullus]
MRSSRPRSASNSRRAPAKPRNNGKSRSAAQNSGIRAELQTLWTQWQHSTPKPPLDRWLRAQRHPKAELSQVLTHSEAMFHALRFQQLACALEALLDDNNLDLNAWDSRWQEDDTRQLHPTAFWYWIELRSLRGWGFTRAVRQQEQRLALFQRLETQVKNAPQSPLALLWHGIRPQWLPLLQERARRSGWATADLQRFLNMQNQQPPLWLRVNELQGPADTDALRQLQQQLQEDGISAQLRDNALCATGGKGVQQSALFRSGRIEVQDFASQQIALALDPQPGEKIWDTCAGAGGKSLALASRLQNKGALVATDLHSYKLDELKRRASRAGARNIRTFVWNGNEPLRLPQEIARHGGFDKILVDAPCTATGTWRRNPDARWRFNDSSLQELLALQQQLLTQAAAALRPGGLLAYATCSWLSAENEEQVARFATASGLSVQEQRLLGAPHHDSDCMFVALLRKPE